MHVHVYCADGEAKFWLEPEIEQSTSHGFSDKQLREALRLIKEHENEIRRAWKSHFGS